MTSPLRAPAAAVLVVLLLTAVACSAPEVSPPAPDPDPAAVVIAYHQALVEDRPADAFALLAPAARQGLDEAAFVDLYVRQREALVAEAAALVDVVRTTPAREHARVQAGDVEVELVRTRDGWRLWRLVEAPAPE